MTIYPKQKQTKEITNKKQNKINKDKKEKDYVKLIRKMSNIKPYRYLYSAKTI